jgi:hypothetical protein
MDRGAIWTCKGYEHTVEEFFDDVLCPEWGMLMLGWFWEVHARLPDLLEMSTKGGYVCYSPKPPL